MNFENISSEDLKLISAVLHQAVADDLYQLHDIPLSVMVRRIHDRIRMGETDAVKLKAAALGAHVVVPFVFRPRPERYVELPKSSA
ncbi:hypothetical protein [Hyphomicrobium sp.]|uniref:hypothetical protein n=1 Tax=Hyphomicrobium sp. TaxID=82 RepID=UPI003F6FDF02